MGVYVKRIGTVRGTDALDPFQGGKVEPLIVRLALVGVDEKRGSLDVARAVEHEQGAIAVILVLLSVEN